MPVVDETTETDTPEMTVAFTAFEEQVNRLRAWRTWFGTLSEEEQAAVVEDEWQTELRSQRNGRS